VDAEPDPVAPPGPEPLEPAPQGPEPQGEPPAAQAVAEPLVELALASVDLSPDGVQPATGTISLVDMEGGGRLDIVMARADAVLVQEAIAGVIPTRPRTHDLLLSTVFALGGSVVGVSILERRAGGVYVASLRVRRPDGSTVELDARPSDALNVALRSTGAGLRAAYPLVYVPTN
jgi:bifunctional DNase/RNase